MSMEEIMISNENQSKLKIQSQELTRVLLENKREKSLLLKKRYGEDRIRSLNL